MKRAALLVFLLAATAFGELSGITYDRATQIQLNTNNMSYVYSNRVATAGVSGLISLQTALEYFWMGVTSYFQNVNIAEDLTVVDDATVGGDLTASGTVTAPTGSFSTVLIGGVAVSPSSGSLSGSQRAYLYANTGTFVAVSGAAGGATFLASTQTIGMLHVGMYVTNAAVFQNATTISAVDYSSRTVTVDKTLSGSASSSSCSFWGNGSYTHTVPTNFSRCQVIVTGGGGSGAANAAAKANAGGGAGTSIGYWSLVGSASYTITVGAGGTSVTGSTAGVTGGTSSFGSLQTATGGAAGPASLGVGGAGGQGTGGTLNLTGGYGEGDGTEYTTGGSSFWGNSGTGGKTVGPFDSTTYGSGGGGGNAAARSGSGGQGVVVVTYY